jgi:hypothetical protein
VTRAVWPQLQSLILGSMGNQNKQLRDVMGGLLHLAGFLVVLVGAVSFRWRLIAVGCLCFVIGYFVSRRKWVAFAVGLGILCLRSVFVLLFVTHDWRAGLLTVISGAGFYAIYRLVPECTEPLD